MSCCVMIIYNNIKEIRNCEKVLRIYTSERPQLCARSITEGIIIKQYLCIYLTFHVINTNSSANIGFFSRFVVHCPHYWVIYNYPHYFKTEQSTMAELGKLNTLEIIKETGSGFYLDGGVLGEILLPFTNSLVSSSRSWNWHCPLSWTYSRLWIPPCRYCGTAQIAYVKLYWNESSPQYWYH